LCSFGVVLRWRWK